LNNRELTKRKAFMGYLVPKNALSISIIGIFSTLICILTIIISVPIPATQGYINIGDAGVMFTALLFGPIIGGIAGGVGSSLADIILGYTIYAPATLIIKGLEGFIVGLIANPKRQISRINSRDIISVIAGGSFMVYGYFLYEIFIWGVIGAVYELFFNGVIQFGLGAIISILLILAIRKILIENFPQVFNQIFIIE
jgi:uncharacterized membrane protein